MPNPELGCHDSRPDSSEFAVAVNAGLKPCLSAYLRPVNETTSSNRPSLRAAVPSNHRCQGPAAEKPALKKAPWPRLDALAASETCVASHGVAEASTPP